MDTAQDIISSGQADLADSHDSLYLPPLLTGLQQRLWENELRLRELLADAGYANGTNDALLGEQHVTAWIPVFGQYKPDIEGFTYDLDADKYTCSAGKDMLFQQYDKTADGG